MVVENVTYYPRCIGNQRWEDDPRRQEFYDKLKVIKDNAVSFKVDRGDFYTNTTYVMKDGKKYVYTEDNDYMIPYSIEEIS